MGRDGTNRAKTTLIVEKNRLIKYVSVATQKDVARNYMNRETQRDVLIHHIEATEPELARLFNESYYDELDNIIETLELKYPKEAQEGERKALGLGAKKVKTRNAKPKSTKPKGKLITYKTKKGMIVSRTYKTGFENKKQTKMFIKTRSERGKSNKEITIEYNKYAKSKGWNERTISSITTFKSRNNIKKKKQNKEVKNVSNNKSNRK